MGIIEIAAIAISLAMDCFCVSLSAGTAVSGENAKRTALKLAVFFGLFQSGMFLAGYGGLASFRVYVEAFDHWIAFILLLLVGGKMVLEFFEKEDDCECGHVKVKNYDNIRVLLLLSVATSIDSFAVGISFSTLKTGILIPVIMIGIASFIFTIAGGYLGRKAGEMIGKKAELIGGLVLIAIGVKVLLEHYNG